MSECTLILNNPVLRNRAARCLANAQTRPIRTMRKWAEEELVIPNGPYEGETFQTKTQPVLGLLLDEFDSGHWVEKYTTGPSQSAKTTGCFVIPIAYHLAEIGENVVCGVPDMNMAGDKWEDDLLEVFLASPSLYKLLPSRGSGSEGGRVTDSVNFTNGAKLKFMSRGARDQGKAGFTARVVCVTEAAGFSVSVETSVESGPLDQLAARQQAWDYGARTTHVEGTLTIPEQLPWSAREDSSRSRIVSPCPNCGRWISPEREHLVGWTDADDILEAEEKAYWKCPSCGDPIYDDQRRESMQDCKILHGEQSIDKRGNVEGELPPTRRLWFHWKAWHNLFVSTGSIAREEWTAGRLPEDSPEKSKAEKKLTQFVHGVCFVPENIESFDLNPKYVARRRSVTPRGHIPKEAMFTSIGVDLAKYTGHWFGMAFLPERIRCFDFGSFGIPTTEMPVQEAIFRALNEFLPLVEAGWAIHGTGEVMRPDLVYIDAGYQTDAVFAWIRSLGRHTLKSKFMPIIGRGSGQMQQQYASPAKVSGRILQIGERWHASKVPKHLAYEITVDADFYKDQIHNHLALHRDSPGALDFFIATDRDLDLVARHLTNEKRVVEFQPGKGQVSKFLKIGQQHWLDAAAYARAAGSRLGWKLPKPYQELSEAEQELNSDIIGKPKE